MYYKPANVIFYTDLEKLIKESYGVKVDIMEMIPEERRGHYTYHEFTVDGESELDSFGDEEIVKHWAETGEYLYIDPSDINITYPDDYDWKYHWEPDGYSVDIRHLLHRLYKDSLIPGGLWYVTVDW